MSEHQYQRFRKGNIIEKVRVKTTLVSTDNVSSSPCYVSVQEVRDAFPDALLFKLDGLPIPFLVDADGNRIEPLRIGFYPDKVLDIVTKVLQPGNSNSNSDSNGNNNTASQLPTPEESADLASQNRLLSIHNNTQVEEIHPDDPNVEQIVELFLEIKKKDERILKLQDEMIKIQGGLIRKDSEILNLKLRPKEKDGLLKPGGVLEPQLEVQPKLKNLEHSVLDRLVALQEHANAIFTQNIDLQEYQIPRLFVILPDSRTEWNAKNLLSNQFRLHFLCEDGDRTVQTSQSGQNQVHITEHEGYEIRSSTEFFRKYGKHMLVLLQWLKLSTSSSSLIDAIDYSIDYMEALSKDDPVLSSINTVDGYEALEVADLQQLSTFLRIDGKEKQYGNLYKTITKTGYVKWVCFEHCRLTYKEREQRVFVDAVKLSGGNYDPQVAKATITLKSKEKSKGFFDALANAGRVYELDITFNWDWTEADLEAFGNALKKSTVSILRLKLGQLRQSINKFFTVVKAFLRYEGVVHIMELGNTKKIHIILSPELVKLSSLQPKRLSYPHKLTMEMRPRKIEANVFQDLANALKTNTTLIALGLEDNSIRKEGARVLSEALKVNTILTTLRLKGNMIGKEGALALSEALKVNTALTFLDLEGNSIGKEGAIALSEALKVNRALTSMKLASNSLGREGTLALSEALKANNTLTTLDLEGNSIMNEGAQALAEALKTNATLTTMKLMSNSIGDKGVLALSEALKTNAALTTLDLEGNSVGDDGALALAGALKINTTLNSLYLWRNSIGDKGASVLSEGLKTNTALTALDLEGNSIGDNGALALSEGLKANKALTTMSLMGNSVKAKGALALSEALKINTSLTTLKLGNNLIGVEGARRLSEALKVNTTLTTLYLLLNSIGDEGALVLSEALKTNAALSTMDLSQNSIGNKGALAISEALKVNKALTTINLNDNLIGAEGAQGLSMALKANMTLTTLRLGKNLIRDEGARGLSEALKINRNLTNLYLWGNSIGDEGVLALSEALKVNEVLTTMDLSQNSIGNKGAQALSEVHKVNPNLSLA